MTTRLTRTKTKKGQTEDDKDEAEAGAEDEAEDEAEVDFENDPLGPDPVRVTEPLPCTAIHSKFVVVFVPSQIIGDRARLHRR
jgi:hypothetical protein